MNLKLITDFLSGSPVTFLLMLTLLVVSSLALWKKRIFAELILHPSSVVKEQQYYRIITSDFVHNDVIHLVLNEFVLYAFCSGLEEHLRGKSPYGSFQFSIIYLASMLTAGIITTIRHRKDFDFSTAGASGSIMGCMFGLMLIDPNGTGLELAVIGTVKNTFAGLFYIVFLILYQRRKGEVNYEFHFYGALGGIAATLALFPNIL